MNRKGELTINWADGRPPVFQIAAILMCLTICK